MFSCFRFKKMLSIKYLHGFQQNRYIGLLEENGCPFVTYRIIRINQRE